LFEGADARRAGIGADHAPLLAVNGHKDVPVRGTAQLTFEGHGARAVRIQRICAAQFFALCDCVAQRRLLALEFSSAVEVEHAIVQVYAVASGDVAALKLSGRALLLGSVGHRGDQQKAAQDQACTDRAACQRRGSARFHVCPLLLRRNCTLRLRRKGGGEASAQAGQELQDRKMKVLICVDTSKQVGDPDHLKVFANEDAAEKWFAEHDPEGVAFEYEVLD